MTLTWARENLSKPKGTLLLNPTSTGTANKNISEKNKLRIEAPDELENISDLDEQKETSEDYLKDDDIPIDDDNNEMSSE